MITVRSVLGNLKRDSGLAREYELKSEKGQAEFIRISRLESERTRMRKVSDKGTDVIITLDQGLRLKHKDVILLTDSKMILVKVEPENVGVVEIKDLAQRDDVIGLALKIGHTLGNLHRPIKIEGKKIFFPIQTDEEIEMFRKLLHSALGHIEINKSVMVFQPEDGMQAHEH